MHMNNRGFQPQMENKMSYMIKDITTLYVLLVEKHSFALCVTLIQPIYPSYIYSDLLELQLTIELSS